MRKAVLVELPFAIIQRTDLSCLQPSRDTVEMKGVLRVRYLRVRRGYVTNSPRNGTLFACCTRLIRLTLYAYLVRMIKTRCSTKIHNMVPADSAVVNDNI
jgi:hypothetical protein